MKYLIEGEDERARVSAEVLALDPTKKWRVEIKLYRPARTNEQLRYWFGVVVKTLSDETGASAQEMHEYLSGEYFGWVSYTVFGAEKQRPARTLSSPELLDRKEMSHLFDWAIAFAARQGILIEYPNE